MTRWIDKVLNGTGRDEVTYFYVGDVFCIYLGTTYVDFQEKIFPETSGKKFQTFHCSNATTMKSLELFPIRSELRLSSKSLQCFTNRVVKFMQPRVYNCMYMSSNLWKLSNTKFEKYIINFFGYIYIRFWRGGGWKNETSGHNIGRNHLLRPQDEDPIKGTRVF